MATTRAKTTTRTIAPKPVVSAERTAAFREKTGYTPSSSVKTSDPSGGGAPTPVGGASTTPTPVSTPSAELKALSIANSPVTQNTRGGINRTSNREASGSSVVGTTGISRTIKTPTIKTAADFEKDLGRSAQKEINALNEYAKTQLDALRPRQEERLAETSSVNTLTGLAGSTEANRMTEKTVKVNQQESDQVRAKLASDVQTILNNVRTTAQTLAQDERTNARLDSEAARAARTEASTNVAVLAQAGVNADAYKTQDPEGYAYLAEQVGGEELLKAMFTLNRPIETVLDKRIEGGKYVIAYQNPIDGKVRIESVDLGLPVGYSKTIDAGNRILAIPDDWDGDPSKLVTINKGLTPSQAASSGGGSGSGGAYASDLDAIIGATEAVITSKFGQETFRKQMSKARNEADKINLVASVVLGKADSATKTDFTNQAVGINQIDKAIKMLDEGAQTGLFQAGAQYTFNLAGKDFDPKLAQINQLLTSAIQPYRNSVTGAAWGNQEDGEYQMLFGSTKYSPDELRQRLVGVKEILASKSAQALNSYVNPLGLYGNQFETGTFAPGGTQSGQLQGPDGTLYDASELTPEEYQDAISNGYVAV